MLSRRILVLQLFFLLISSLVNVTTTLAQSLPLHLIKLPPHFEISVYVNGIKGARSMAWGKQGTLFVGTREEGKIYAIVNAQGSHKNLTTHSPSNNSPTNNSPIKKPATNKHLTNSKNINNPDNNKNAETSNTLEIIVLASGLDMPNGIAIHGNDLYVAENSRVIRFQDIENHLHHPPKPTLIARLPTVRHHGWRYMRFGPDGWLYVAIGAPCNVCISKNPIFASIIRMQADGSQRQIYAHGVRNSVGFTWHPVTKQLWFTDNGRDWLGDNLPPDELNMATQPGQHFGFPYVYGDNTPDNKFYPARPSNTPFIPPVQKLSPHVAALGMVFYTGKLFPAAYQNQVFIAEHGSWNRSHKIGYRISLVKLDGNKGISYQPFAYGWLQGQKNWGRPVDLLEMADGSLLLSDDQAGVIYRISYKQS